MFVGLQKDPSGQGYFIMLGPELSIISRLSQNSACSVTALFGIEILMFVTLATAQHI